MWAEGRKNLSRLIEVVGTDVVMSCVLDMRKERPSNPSKSKQNSLHITSTSHLKSRSCQDTINP
jgi:hypothetical protein